MNQLKNLIDTLMFVLVLTPSYFFSNFVLSLIYSGNPIMSTTASALGEKRIVSQVKDPPSIDVVIRSLKLTSQKTSCSIQLLHRPTYKKDLIHSTTARRRYSKLLIFVFVLLWFFYCVSFQAASQSLNIPCPLLPGESCHPSSRDVAGLSWMMRESRQSYQWPGNNSNKTTDRWYYSLKMQKLFFAYCFLSVKIRVRKRVSLWPGTERFSTECRRTKTKAKVITLTNHKRLRQLNEPIRIWGNHMQPAPSAGNERVQLAIGFGFATRWLRKWRKFCWQIRHRAKQCKIKANKITIRHSNENCSCLSSNQPLPFDGDNKLPYLLLLLLHVLQTAMIVRILLFLYRPLNISPMNK